MAVITKDLGAVSAYAVAVANGFTGTEAEWEQYMADAANNAMNAAGSATAAANSAASAAQSATEAATSKVAAAGSAVDAENSALVAGNHAAAAAASATAAETAETGAETAQTAAEAAQAAAEAVAASIPEDYTELSEDVSSLKSALSGGTVTVHQDSANVINGYWIAVSGNVITLGGTTGDTYKTIQTPIDISGCVVGSQITTSGSIIQDFGIFIADADYKILVSVTGNNPGSLTPSNTPQEVTLTVPSGAKYLVSDIRSTKYTDPSQFDATMTVSGIQNEIETLDSGTVKKNQGVANAGKVLSVGADGIVAPTDLPDVTDTTLVSGLTADDVNPGYINKNNIPTPENTQYYYTNYIYVAPYQSITITGLDIANASGYAMAFVDENYRNPGLVLAYGGDEARALIADGKLTLSIPEGAAYFRTSQKRASIGSLTITGKLKYISAVVEMVKEKNPDDLPCQHIIRDGGFVRIFKNIGVVGDSLSSGAMSLPNDGTVPYDQETTTDNVWWSWIQYIARTCGNTGRNFSQGGLRASSLRKAVRQTSASAQEIYRHLTGYDIDDVDHEDAQKCELYFIALAYNDLSRANSDPTYLVSDDDDIDFTDEENNSDTFRGNYAYIIQKIKKVQPKAIIVCITAKQDYYQDEELFKPYNDVIRQMPGLFNTAGNLQRVYCMDMAKYCPELTPGWEYSYGHGNTMGYLNFSWQVASYMDWIIRHNYEVFKYVQFIGTNIGPD